ncbi:MAG: type II toxin-antitoxin system VapC family toxin [bacterium]|nr:type II toxin-antitoxin system VapC family toxin [bacterium]
MARESVIAFQQKKKIKLPDAIILATATFMKCDLLTRNVKDFSRESHEWTRTEKMEVRRMRGWEGGEKQKNQRKNGNSN